MNLKLTLHIFSIIFYLLFICFFCSSCNIFSRHQNSGYQNSNLPIKKNLNLKNDVANEKLTLKQLENGLSSPRELQQYSKILHLLNSDSEKIEFLSLNSFEKKQKWIAEKKINSRAHQISNQMKEIIDAQDIALGMTEVLVKKSWGDPDSVEISGSPYFHNQRWVYQKFVSTSDGYKPEKKIVYFESGKVVGWDLE